MLHMVLAAVVIRALGYYNAKTKSCSVVKTSSRIFSLSFLVFGSYFGRKPDPVAGEKSSSLRALLFGVCLVGNVIFMSYRASLVSELSVAKKELPFTNWKEFIDSQYQ